MSYPKHMNDEELLAFGFVVSPDDPNVAYHRLYPRLSRRHRCSSCGIWSSVTGGKELVCPLCSARRRPAVNRQFHKLYMCCADHECPIRMKAFQLLREKAVDTHWPSHDGFGEYISLKDLPDMSEDEYRDFQEKISDLSVSKFGARKLVHPGSKSKSKLPTSKRSKSR